jgi:hypothetical protein
LASGRFRLASGECVAGAATIGLNPENKPADHRDDPEREQRLVEEANLLGHFETLLFFKRGAASTEDSLRGKAEFDFLRSATSAAI